MNDRSSKWKWLAFGAVVGAAVLFIFDPISGRRRRARLIDKGLHYKKLVLKTIDRKQRHWKNRLQGLSAHVDSASESAPRPAENTNLSSTAERAAEKGAEYLH